MISSPHSEISKIIGRPWVENASGPDAFDCWGVVEYVYKKIGKPLSFNFDFDHKNKTLVNMCMEIQKESPRFIKIDKAEEYSIALMYESGRPTHVGVIINGDVLHSISSKNNLKGGVCLHKMLFINRMFEKIEYYKPT
tara:strand:+ start:1871 stop:2284 length:414 start_codon:yes stop_codon:yes gene_type:complete